MPLPATHLQSVQATVKMANASDLSLRGGQRPTWRPEREARGSALGVQSREGSHVDRTRHCRGAACRSRRRTYSPYKPPSKWQTLPIYHCEEANGRRGALSAKREEVPLGCNLGKAPPIYTECRRTQSLPNLTVAALSERLVRDNSTVGGRWCATALP